MSGVCVYARGVELTTEQMVLVALIAVGGATLQGVLGFGIALFALPLMVWAGVSLPVAIAVVQVTAMSQMGWGCWRYRDQIAWKPALGVNACRVLGQPLGWASLVWLVAAGQGTMKQAVGAAILLAVVLRVTVRVKPRAKVRWWWTAIAGFFSGYTGGVVGMSGPPLVLWVTAHEWSTNKTRVMLWIAMLPMMPLSFAFLIYWYGMPVVQGGLLGLAAVPVSLAGAMWGTRMGAKLPVVWLRGAALGLLVVIALASIAQPVMALGGR